MFLFGVVLGMEIGFCNLIEVCYNDLQQMCTDVNERAIATKNPTAKSLKDSFEMHQEILK